MFNLAKWSECSASSEDSEGLCSNAYDDSWLENAHWITFNQGKAECLDNKKSLWFNWEGGLLIQVVLQFD